MDDAETSKIVEAARQEYQAKFDQDPAEYAKDPMNGLGFIERTGLIQDARNTYYPLLGLWNNPETGSFEFLAPIPKYEEYISTKIHPVGLNEYLMKTAKPEFVAEFDRLAGEFNSELETIKAKKDQGRIKYFGESLENLFKP